MTPLAPLVPTPMRGAIGGGVKPGGTHPQACIYRSYNLQVCMHSNELTACTHSVIKVKQVNSI